MSKRWPFPGQPSSPNGFKQLVASCGAASDINRLWAGFQNTGDSQTASYIGPPRPHITSDMGYGGGGLYRSYTGNQIREPVSYICIGSCDACAVEWVAISPERQQRQTSKSNDKKLQSSKPPIPPLNLTQILAPTCFVILDCWLSRHCVILFPALFKGMSERGKPVF